MTNDKNKSNSQSSSSREQVDDFNVLAWLVEGAVGITSELKRSDLGLGSEFWNHTQNVHREGLLAARALLDHLIERHEQEPIQEAEREKRRERRGNISIG